MVVLGKFVQLLWYTQATIVPQAARQTLHRLRQGDIQKISFM
jgi:hypothetical protein